MSKSASMSTDTIQVKGKKQKSQILQAMVEALYRFNPRGAVWQPHPVHPLAGGSDGDPGVAAGAAALRRCPIAGLAADRLALAHPLVCQLRRDPGRGAWQARADSLKAGMSQLKARRVTSPQDDKGEWVPATSLLKGDLVLVRSGEMIPTTAKWSPASPRSTRRPSPANPPPSSASPAPTAAA